MPNPHKFKGPVLALGILFFCIWGLLEIANFVMVKILEILQNG